MASAERGESVAGPLRHGATFGSVERKCASSREWLFTAVESCRQHCGSGTFASDFPPGLFGAQRRWNKEKHAEDDEPGAAAVYDPATGTITAMRNFPGFVFAVQANPTGSQFIVLDDTNGLVLYDSQLNPLGSIPPGFADTGVLFSVDGNKFTCRRNGNPAIPVKVPTLAVLDSPRVRQIPRSADILPPYVIETPFTFILRG